MENICYLLKKASGWKRFCTFGSLSFKLVDVDGWFYLDDVKFQKIYLGREQ